MLYDVKVLSDQCDGDPDLMRRVVEVFLADCDAQVEALRDAFLRGDAERLFSVAHSIKGTVGNFGARRAVHAAVEVEACCRSGRLQDAAASVDELARAVQSLAGALRCARL